jgi:hypothetical protein
MFHFEVSPQREKCLLQQVLPIPRTPDCCGKATVGGYPPYYNQWFEPGIKRADPTLHPKPDYVWTESCLHLPPKDPNLYNEQLFDELNTVETFPDRQVKVHDVYYYRYKHRYAY